MLYLKITGAILVNEILKRRLQLRDATIGIIASLFEITSHSMWFITVQTWQIYLGKITINVQNVRYFCERSDTRNIDAITFRSTVPIFGVFERVIQLISISLATKCVAPEEYGKYFR